MKPTAHLPSPIIDWLNWIIKIMWIAHKDEFHNKISNMESIIKQDYKDFKFLNINIGNVPCRIDDVVVEFSYIYHSTSVTMDISFSYKGDSNVEFQVFTLLQGGITNFQLHGKIRVTMTFSIVNKEFKFETLDIYMLNEPSVDFDVNGLIMKLFKSTIASSIKPEIAQLIKGVVNNCEKEISNIAPFLRKSSTNVLSAVRFRIGGKTFVRL